MSRRWIDLGRPVAIGVAVVALTNLAALLVASVTRTVSFTSTSPNDSGPVFNQFEMFPRGWWLFGAIVGLLVMVRALMSPGIRALLQWVAVLGVLGLLLAGVWDETWWSRNFTISALAGGVFMLVGLTAAWRRRSWKRVKETWLSFGGVAACSVGGFGLIGLTDELKTTLSRIALERSEISPTLLALLALAAVLLLTVAGIMNNNGRAQTPDETGHEPTHLFVPMFWCAWLANVLLVILVFDSILLTAIAFLSPDFPRLAGL